MCLGGDADGTIGARISDPGEWAPGLLLDAALFGETQGFVVEVAAAQLPAFHEICKSAGADATLIGATGGARIIVNGTDGDVALSDAANAWSATLKEFYA
jgi:hypothetical protein